MPLRTVVLFGAIALTACAGGGPGAPGYPFNVSGTYRGTLTLEEREHRARVELETRADGTVVGTLTVLEPRQARGDFSGTISADTLVWRSSYRVPARGCGGVARGVGPVDRSGGAIRGSLRVDDSCRGARTGRVELIRSAPPGG